MTKYAFIPMFVLVLQTQAWAQSRCERTFITPQDKNAPSVVVISGTNRDGSQSIKVAETMKEFLQKSGANAEVLDLATVPPSTYSSANYFNTPRAFKDRFDKKIANAQSIVIVVPEYHGSFPGVLKTFFDYVQAPLTNKPVTLIGVSAGKWGARNPVSSFAETLLHRKASITGSTRINIENVDQKMGYDRVADTEIRSRMEKSAKEIVHDLKAKAATVVSGERLVKLAELKETVDVVLNSGLEIEGPLTKVILSPRDNQVAYLNFAGPTRLKENGKVHKGQDVNVHGQGFSSPIGTLKNGTRLSNLKESDLAELGLIPGERALLEFSSGVTVEGIFMKSQSGQDGKIQIMTWNDCTVLLGEKKLYSPAWGTFDMAIGETVSRVLMQ